MADTDEGMYVSQVRNVTLRSDLGHVIHFPKGKPVYVPPAVRAQAVELACLPVNGEMPFEQEVEEEPELQGDPRIKRLDEAVAMLATINDSKDFTSAGVPQIPALMREAKLVRVTASERDEAWMRYLQSKNTG